MGDQSQRDARFWDRAARKYADVAIADPNGFDNTLQVVKERLSGKGAGLALGCGTGTAASTLAHRTGNYLATDIARALIKLVRRKADEAPAPNLAFQVGAPWDDAVATGQL